MVVNASNYFVLQSDLIKNMFRNIYMKIFAKLFYSV